LGSSVCGESYQVQETCIMATRRRSFCTLLACFFASSLRPQHQSLPMTRHLRLPFHSAFSRSTSVIAIFRQLEPERYRFPQPSIA
jgi:hypothetical protein